MNLTLEQKDNLILIGALMKGVAHNINTPLSAIMGLSEIVQCRVHKLKESYGKNFNGMKEEFDKIERDIAIILQNSEKVSHIMRNAAQKSLNEQSSAMQPINLSLLLKEEISFLEADMTFKHKIEKVYHINEAIPSINGVYSHFSYSFYHVLENSKRAMETAEEKKLTITSDCDGTYIIVKIHDTRYGFATDTREKLVNFLNAPLDHESIKINIDGGMAVIKTLLHPYKPVFDISSIPGNTNFIIRFPV